ncbi:MAG: hypothetical protein M1492_08695 [Gammaproteobacteria bacterium]|jgi:hypothetical protein|uniref:hypothetical protein n=1 Tax=Acidithiobacillus ferrooxidans TaxID=920 RepID=UPI002148D75A|nr:hypothetical protein [Acidithiobacillus ferrooxidans]MCL4526529.1 hypothetical protein [Gammaproteobacteria bacterium]MCR1347071.1 hypothetical protein [Acidithiobacillus ferrooxidans]MCR1355865.1 hypothetical protein [Acidithiobacillus ferrooxidans]MDA8376730.1 hypothetical protein [Planctomycetia bacterium]
MGTPTGVTVHTVRNTRRGSDYYGDCEMCGKECSEHFVAAKRHVWVRDNGQHILDHGSGGTYGHLDCLTKRFGDLVSQETLERDGRAFLIPEAVFDDLQSKTRTLREACL